MGSWNSDWNCVWVINWICDELWDNMLLWNYNIIIEIEYKCKVEHVLICNIHVKCDDRFWHCEMLKLWTWNLVVNKCVVNTWGDITYVVSCEWYNNSTGVYFEKSVYAQGVKRKT